MTIEEAIEALTSKDVCNSGIMLEALEMAIKALEQERSRSAEITQYRHDCEKLMEENERLKKALEQEPCEDAISRQAVIDIIKSLHNANPSYWNTCDVVDRECALDEITALPSVQPKSEWFPVSERLPEDLQRVLVTIERYNGDKVVRVAEYYGRIFQIKENREQWEVGEKGLLAWMPIPQPYKAEGEEG